MFAYVKRRYRGKNFADEQRHTCIVLVKKEKRGEEQRERERERSTSISALFEVMRGTRNLVTWVIRNFTPPYKF